jgi:hypothetical protein
MKILVTGGAGFIPPFYEFFEECGMETRAWNIDALRMGNIP